MKNPWINSIPGVSARFFGRVPGVDVVMDRSAAMSTLAPFHEALLQQENLGAYRFVTAEQVHGNRIALVDNSSGSPSLFYDVDGLMTSQREITLGIYVADCAPVWVVAKNGSAGTLIHSGKMGTELGIVARGIAMLCNHTNLVPEELIVEIGPCIRPPLLRS